jgi:hypothetical protein
MHKLTRVLIALILISTHSASTLAYLRGIGPLGPLVLLPLHFHLNLSTSPYYSLAHVARSPDGASCSITQPTADRFS